MDPEHPVDEIEYQERPRPPFLHKKGDARKKWLIIGGVVAAILLLAAGVYWFVLRKPAAAPVATKASSEEQAASKTPSGPVSFKSPTLGMEVTYGNGWTLAENADKSEIMLTSPKSSYQGKDGKSVDGVFTVKLRHGVIPAGMTSTIQKAIAIRDSEVIAYAAPTAAQRQYTNVSYVGSDSNTFGFFIVSGNTALKAGSAVGNNIDLVGDVYLITGGYGTDANDTLTFEPASKSVLDTAVFKEALDIVKSVKID